MKKYLILAAFAAAALAVSCQTKEIINDVTESNEIEAEAPVMVTYKCEFDQANTKLNITDAGKVTWEVGDEIMIHSDVNERYTVKLTAADISADGKTATLTFPAMTKYTAGTIYKSTYYATYPASAVTSTNALYYETRISDFSIPPMGGYDNGETGADAKIILRNLCGIIKFTVSGDFDEYIFSGNKDEVVAYLPDYQCRLALNEDDSVDYRRTSSNGANSAASTTLPGTVKADGSTVNYICIPGGANLTGGFTIKFKKEGAVVKVAKTNTSVNIATSKILALGDITGKLNDYVPPTVSDHVVATEYAGATDLSTAKGPSNSYIITSAGYYKLPAVKGNKADQTVGNVFGVTLVWETYNNGTSVTKNSVIAGVDFDASENYIYFKTPDTLLPGNALIAAKDADGNIIWSWHIWIPQTTITTNTHGIYTKALMDRNLGALVATATGEAAAVESFGLLYQWGRKDPFIGAKRNNTSSFAYVAGISTSATAGDGTTEASKMTLAESIQNPTVLGHFQGGDWVTPSDNSLWKNGEKTIYDPCPPGYRVPARAKSQPLHSDDLTAQTGWSVNADNKYVTIGNPVAVFPLTGYHDDWSSSLSSISSYGKRTVLWTAYSSSEKYGYFVNIRQDKAVYLLDEAGKTRTGSVRCCVE